MSEYRDFEEKSVDTALEKACSELGVAPEQLQYDIISHGSSGIFGLVGAKRAVIRVLVQKPQNEPSDEAESADQQEGGDPEEEENKTASALVDEAFGPSSVKEEGGSEPEQAPVSDDDAQDIDEQSRGDAVEWTKGLLNMIVGLISPDSEVSIRDQGDVIRFEVTGGDSARLIGKRGQTLDAIHYLVERGVYKQFGGSIPIEIDVEGYLEKRRADLSALASRLAEKARQTGKPMVINRINAQDRRLVHLSLREDREVRTQSVGNGDFRKLLILPKKKGQAKQSSSGDQ